MVAVSYIDFTEERLELGVDYGVVGGHQFSTEIVENKAGFEQRNCLWWQPLGRWQLGQRMLLDGDEKHINEVDYLRSFHSARRGSFQGFRFKDWCDYSATSQHLGTTDGVTQSWQLKKTYTVGTQSTHRPILKPVLGTVKIYLDGVEIKYHLVNSETGLISFAVPPAAGQILSCDFEFDVPVQFEADKIEWKTEAVQLDSGQWLHSLGSVFVKEIRINPDIEWYHKESLPQVITDPLDLGVILDVVETLNFASRQEVLASGFKSKNSDRDIVKGVLKIPSRQYNKEEWTQILNYFWLAKGQCVSFYLKLNQKVYFVRFDRDSLAVKFLFFDCLFETDLTMHLLGIVEQCKIANLYPANAILILTGEDYIDRSPYGHSAGGTAMQIVNNSYYFPSTSSRIGSTSALYLFGSDDFSIEISAHMTAYNNDSGISHLVSNWGFSGSFQQFKFSITNSNFLQFIFKPTSGNIVTVEKEIPDLNFLMTFQCFKVQREGNIMKLFYNSIELISQDIGNVEFFASSYQTIFLGYQLSAGSFAFTGYMKEIVLTRN